MYGLEIAGMAASERWLARAGAEWSAVEVVRRQGRVGSARRSLEGDRIEFPLGGDGQLVVDREARRCVFTTPEPLSDMELIHPYMAPVGAAFAWWEGREAIHAGGFGTGQGVWGVVGERGSGKSSLLGWLALQGFDVMCDDMLVVAAGAALAGPRCVDLRAPAARHFGVGELLSIGGLRERWRVALGQVTPERPLLGWIFLEWGPAVDAVRVPASERLLRLARNRSMMVEPRDSARLLDLAVLPGWLVTRPQDWAFLPDVVERLVALDGG